MTFKISDKHFQGYEVTLDLDYFETIEEIVNQVTNTLKTHLELHKLVLYFRLQMLIFVLY